MNTLNAEQKIWLAKMLPNNLRIDGIGELWWIKDASESVRWPVKPTEHLHLISLVEAKLTPEQRWMETHALASIVDADTPIANANAPQRCTALMELFTK